ncbi:uncharacterized protein LOC123292973 [Chrysoperla carnea]|uniref:uncharacterized protein LOC123292973 n=1 Tax=Chrysoperla carnea TaxID=189513 RepID=UPI001D06386E|nr:uncharacterized protein LOC123292973 [Chrysoperla carnea]
MADFWRKSGTNALNHNSTQKIKNLICPSADEIEEDNFVSISPICNNDEDCYKQFSDTSKRCCRRKDNVKRCLNGISYKTLDNELKSIESSKIDDNLICPSSSRNIENFNFFSLPCSTHDDCIQYAGINKRCCKGAGIVNRCVDGVPKRKPKSPHFTFFGRRECPNFNDINYENGKEPFAVLFRHPVTECKDDKECWPLRICCPEFAENDLENGKNYCQVPVTNLDNTLIKDYLGHFLSHIQCTPPPPAYLDLFPKPCKNTFDCLPKVCCREAANQNFCRPPKKNVVGLLAAVLKVMSFLFKSN